MGWELREKQKILNGKHQVMALGIEIERRFLVKGDGWKALAGEGIRFRQGYLASNANDWTIRIRITEMGNAYLTLKKTSQGIAQNEFEYPIPINEAEALWTLVTKRVIKTRHIVNHAGMQWAVDCFQGENFPLILAEIELTSPTQKIDIPQWCGEEITGQYQWSNAVLAENPIKNTSIEMRLEEQKQ